ncbi:MAG: M12 family metallo-peptidase [Methanoregula sp.]|jgi:hypothetical protein|nr:M12 family metallo-peptidase [Methanoregula sp.]
MTQLKKTGVVLLLLLVAGMAIVPCVSAVDDRIVSKNDVLDMKFIMDNPISEMRSQIDYQSTAGRLDALSEYALVTVDPQAFMNTVDKTEQVTFTIRGTKYILNLESVKSPVDENTKIYSEGPDGETIIEVPHIKTYKGNVEGVMDSDALFTASDDGVVGYISMDKSRYVLDQLGPGLRKDGRTVHVLFDNSKWIKNPETKTEEFDVHLVAEPATAKTSDEMDQVKSGVDASIKSTTTVDLLVVTDTEFRQVYSNPNLEISNRISAANSAFSPAEVFLYVRSIRSDYTLTNTYTETLLSDFGTAYGQMKINDGCDVALLLSGKNLAGMLAGSYLYNGNTNAAWAVVQMVPRPGNTYQATTTHRSLVITHELGHTVGALHTMPGNIEPSPTWARPATWWDGWSEQTTVMSRYFMGDTQQLQFSSSSYWPLGYHGDATHDNRRVIIEDKATVAGYN